MPLEIIKLPKPTMRPQIVASERLWRTKDGTRLVPDGHADAAILFCAPGQPVDKAEFEALTVDEGAAVPPPEEDSEDPEATKTNAEAVARMAEVGGDSQPTEPEADDEGDADADAEGDADSEQPEAEGDDKPKRQRKKDDKAKDGPAEDK